MDSIDIELSEQARARLADGSCPVSEAELIANTRCVLQHICGGNSYFMSQEKALELIQNGSMDAHAWVCFRYEDAQETTVRDSLLAMAVHYYWREEDVALLSSLIKKAGPNVLNKDGVPAYVTAFKRYIERDTYSPYAWNDCCESDLIDMEIAYEGGVQQVVHMNHTSKCQLSGTLLNQLCQKWDFIRRHNAGDDSEHGIYYLLDMGAILAPEWLSLKEVSGPGQPYVPKWQEAFDALCQAIANGDRKAVNEAIAHNAHARGFSLGHGSQLCQKEFWGNFWDEGLGAMLSLPAWIQEYLAQELTQSLMRELPHSHVMQPDALGRMSEHFRQTGL